MTTTNNSIINVTVNGMVASEAITNIKSRLETVEKSAFNIALLCVYTLGDTIPPYTDNKGVDHGEAICDNPIKKQADLLKLIGRSKATLSRWIKAMRLIIEKGHFTDFANGSLPFSYDKIITIFENDSKFTDYILSDLMAMTVDTLEAMSVTVSDNKTKEKKPSEENKEETTESEENKEETTEEEVTILTYKGKDYTVPKIAFEKWLAENGKVVIK